MQNLNTIYRGIFEKIKHLSVCWPFFISSFVLLWQRLWHYFYNQLMKRYYLYFRVKFDGYPLSLPKVVLVLFFLFAYLIRQKKKNCFQPP